VGEEEVKGGGGDMPEDGAREVLFLGGVVLGREQHSEALSGVWDESCTITVRSKLQATRRTENRSIVGARSNSGSFEAGSSRIRCLP
jgi:hypothetical protein